jgi:allantoin racemase
LVPVRSSCFLLDFYYESAIFDAYIAEAGLQAEDEGFDAVVMDTVSDSGLQILRSRLTIPVSPSTSPGSSVSASPW